jgi:hypothetical protein
MESPMRKVLPVSLLLLTPGAWGQLAVSARSGMIQYAEGRVLLAGEAVTLKPTQFRQMSKGQTLETEAGRAEVLLTPGAFLRLSEDSSIRMASTALYDTRIEVLSGSALVEVDELLEDNAITLLAGDAQIALQKQGLYRVDAGGSSKLRVFDGEALVSAAGGSVKVKKGREVSLDQTLAVAKFDRDDTDAFDRWSERRAGYTATASISSARAQMAMFRAQATPGWTYNPWFGLFTFVPGTGYGYSPYGLMIFSPVTVQYVAVTPTGAVAVRSPTVRSAGAGIAGFDAPFATGSRGGDASSAAVGVSSVGSSASADAGGGTRSAPAAGARGR